MVYVKHGDNSVFVKVSMGAPDFDDMQKQVRAKLDTDDYDFEFTYAFKQDDEKMDLKVNDSEGLMNALDAARVQGKVLVMQAEIMTKSPTPAPTEPYYSCKERAELGMKSGVYAIKEGVKGYCNMDLQEKKGYTLLMKIDNTSAPKDNPFNYNSDHWKESTTLNPSNYDMSKGYSKYAEFNTMKCKTFALEWPTWDQGVNKWFINADSPTRALDFFQKNQQIAFGGEVHNRPELNKNYFATQSGYQKFGIAFRDGPDNNEWGHGCRWGFAYNNEEEKNSVDVVNGMACQLGENSNEFHNYANGEAYGCCSDNPVECKGKKHGMGGWNDGWICEYRAMLYCTD